jgi:formyltetrahydrofolate deformylase
MNSPILLIDSPDEKGLIHTITGVIFRHNHNIIRNDEYVDHETGMFFMRTEIEGDCETEGLIAELTHDLPEGAHARFAPKQKRKIVILVTKEHHCLGDLLIRNAFNEFNAEILAVIGNHETLKPLTERFDIPFHFIPNAGLNKQEHEAKIRDVIAPYKPEYIVLAKYMRILSPEFIADYPARIINIHHSFLPAFAGASPYRQAFERGVKIIGATAHFVTEELDEGPILAQSVIPVDHNNSVNDMILAGRDVEKNVLAKALRLVFEERVFLCGKRVVIFD